jgi:hypothetical protein
MIFTASQADNDTVADFFNTMLRWACEVDRRRSVNAMP